MSLTIARPDLEAAVIVLAVGADGSYECSTALDAAEVVAHLRRCAGDTARNHGVRICRVCGCTDLSACNPPCSWISSDTCSSHQGLVHGDWL